MVSYQFHGFKSISVFPWSLESPPGYRQPQDERHSISRENNIATVSPRNPYWETLYSSQSSSQFIHSIHLCRSNQVTSIRAHPTINPFHELTTRPPLLLFSLSSFSLPESKLTKNVFSNSKNWNWERRPSTSSIPSPTTSQRLKSQRPLQTRVTTSL